MSDKRKIGPIRQLSLQSENHRLIRPILKKQLSVEQLDRIEEQHKVQPRVESAKNKLHDRPRPIKVAWAENRTNKEEIPTIKGKFNDTVDVKKCKEHKRPTTASAKLRTQSSVEKESILCTRQELAERLRKAWKEREDNKQNLDIFLNHQNDNKHFDDLENENYYPDYEDKCVLEKTINTTEEKIIAQFKPTNFINNNNNNTKNNNIKVCKSPETEFNYVPSTTSSRPQDVRTITNISVTIPSVNSLVKPMQETRDSSPPSLEATKSKPEEKKSSLMSPKENLPPSRPHTASAASKRESFQKRTNTAFTGSITGTIPNNTTEKPPVRPPLIRALSVPAPLPQRAENNKLKFIATKRRLKSARKRNKEGTSENSDENDEKTNKKGSRCKSAPNGDVVTMVSLVSPAGSDTEEVADPKKEQKGRNSSPVKTNIDTVNKTIALRKSVKSVSFQQSSIHAVRSFSASFPARRGILASSASVTEKRAPMEATPDGESRGPKRRLVKSFSVAGDEDINQRINSQDSFEETPSTVLPSQKSPKGSTDSLEVEVKVEVEVEDKVQINDEDVSDESEEELFDPNMPKFETNKEKECWMMYKKMCDKGLPVSFDTILRGMLTPTEYRNTRKEIQTTPS